MKKTFIALTAILYLLISGCSQGWYDARNTKRLEAYFIQYPLESAQLSNKIYPCFNGIAKSDTVIRHDTTLTAGDTSISVVHDTVKVTIKLPGKNITTTKTIHDSIPDTRKIDQLQLSFKAQTDTANAAKNAQIKSLQQYQDEHTTAAHRLWWIIGLSALIAVAVIWKIYKFFSGGAVTGAAKSII